MKALETKFDSMLERQLPSLSDRQLDAMRRFSTFDIGAEELRQSLIGANDLVLNTRHEVGDRYAWLRASVRFRLPEPGIVITREHIANALERKRFGLITEHELVEWATILLTNDAYVLDPGDEDLIAEWLNDISVNLDAD